jgi:redox-sensitive bicupin YhaK (pirin superfamily)
MITVRYAEERGRANLGWLDSRHSFSFADYFDAKHMGFGPLRVINEDRVREGAGFDTHGHRDMEIISYVLEGELEHKDSIGTGSVIRPGDVQRMSAGAGVRHSEFNPSKTAPVHFLQIWIMPDQQGVAPSYEQKHFADADKKGRLRLIASKDGRDGSVKIHQDASVYAALLDPGQEVAHEIAPARLAWLQVAQGVVTLNGQELRAGDGAAVENETAVKIASLSDGSEVLLFDLPK